MKINDLISIDENALAYLVDLLKKNNPDTLSCKLVADQAGTLKGQTILVYYEKSDEKPTDILIYEDIIKIYLEDGASDYLKDTNITLDEKDSKLVIKSPFVKLTPNIDKIANLTELQNKSIKLIYDCEGILIPHGTKISLKKDTIVVIVQALGSFFTIYYQGMLVRLNLSDSASLGLSETQIAKKKREQPSIITKEFVLEVLKECYDPEIPVNIVDLGLIYDVIITKNTEKFDIQIEMTLTAMGCSMGDFITIDIRDTLKTIDIVGKVSINVVFDPAWNKDMMSEVAKLKLGML